MHIIDAGLDSVNNEDTGALVPDKGMIQMKRPFFLRGLAEGLTGVSTVSAVSLEEIFILFPALAAVKDKLTIDGDTIKGFAPCDG